MLCNSKIAYSQESSSYFRQAKTLLNHFIMISYYDAHEILSGAVAAHIIERVEKSPSVHIGFATGYSPIRTYEKIADYLQSSPLLRTKISGFQIDEWLGLGIEDSGSCSYALKRDVITPWQLKTDSCFIIDGNGSNAEKQILAMKNRLNQRPLDICILGIGKNGHLALNEPGSKLTDPCRIVELEGSSQEHNMLSSTSKAINKGITIGIKEILESKEIILIISGEGKQSAYQNFKEKKHIENFPGSALYYHQNWKCFVNRSSVE